ncbi:hypothetical protein LMG28688_03804 [Paraburkholderia caffeinitolerans]|uniref:Uncharacterized protein n=1 Tax=Paraburkholderia caffeinitolerans TaxID=1723730 RepID=A0A6J5GC18_9BURK|nr:hypothetical protein LMG28688_03804 [Paraburkholderia caffeinitolerans]
MRCPSPEGRGSEVTGHGKRGGPDTGAAQADAPPLQEREGNNARRLSKMGSRQ